MTREIVKHIVAAEYARASAALKKGEKMAINARSHKRMAVIAMKYLEMEAKK